MQSKSGFWSGMRRGVRIRFIVGFIYLALAVGVLSQSPMVGIVLLTLPILWTVLVIWTGSEDGVGFGPYSRGRDGAFAHLLRYLWSASGLTKVVLSVVVCAVVIGGLGWVSTEKMRAEAREPTLSERVSSAAESASEATKETASGWLSTAKGWFTWGEEEF